MERLSKASQECVLNSVEPDMRETKGEITAASIYCFLWVWHHASHLTSFHLILMRILTGFRHIVSKRQAQNSDISLLLQPVFLSVLLSLFKFEKIITCFFILCLQGELFWAEPGRCSLRFWGDWQELAVCAWLTAKLTLWIGQIKIWDFWQKLKNRKEFVVSSYQMDEI